MLEFSRHGLDLLVRRVLAYRVSDNRSQSSLPDISHPQYRSLANLSIKARAYRNCSSTLPVMNIYGSSACVSRIGIILSAKRTADESRGYQDSCFSVLRQLCFPCLPAECSDLESPLCVYFAHERTPVDCKGGQSF